MNIYEKIAAIYEAVQYLAKDDKVEFGSTKYKALSEEKVTTIMRQQFIKHKLIVIPVEMTSSRSGQISHVDVKYQIINVENPEEFIEVVSCGDGADSQDKGAGKAMTYAFKYMWLRTFALPTGEDPDKISSEELDAQQAAEKRKVICEACGKEIAAVTLDDGKTVSVAKILKRGKDDFSRKLCFDCLGFETKRRKQQEAMNGA